MDSLIENISLIVNCILGLNMHDYILIIPLILTIIGWIIVTRLAYENAKRIELLKFRRDVVDHVNAGCRTSRKSIKFIGQLISTYKTRYNSESEYSDLLVYIKNIYDKGEYLESIEFDWWDEYSINRHLFEGSYDVIQPIMKIQIELNSKLTGLINKIMEKSLTIELADDIVKELIEFGKLLYIIDQFLILYWTNNFGLKYSENNISFENEIKVIWKKKYRFSYNNILNVVMVGKLIIPDCSPLKKYLIPKTIA